ncbi:hypothetical protein RJT34_06460 [Clitoria ternatea]|uniref:Legume lectin domain-containing protein n=1 Tax=Clitoria ternatea TaxID=43366 RepID=A0AAN9K3S9_CLITE
MPNSKSKLLATQHPFSVFLTIYFILLININVKSDSVSFNFPRFDASNRSFAVDSDTDATISRTGILQLTKEDQHGNPTQHSVGIAGFFGTIPLSNKSSSKIANFTTQFSFVVDPEGSQHSTPPKTRLSPSSLIALRMSGTPTSHCHSPHIGININSIRSVATVPWARDSEPLAAIGVACISYESAYKMLNVSVAFYPNNPVTVLSYPVDFSAILSERVLIGFSAATGEVVETHDILSWSFTSSL